MSFDKPMQDIYWPNDAPLTDGSFNTNDQFNQNGYFQDLNQQNIEMLNQVNDEMFNGSIGNQYGQQHQQQPQQQQHQQQHSVNNNLRYDQQNSFQQPPSSSFVSSAKNSSVSAHSPVSSVDKNLTFEGAAASKYMGISPESLDEKQSKPGKVTAPAGSSKKSLLDAQDAILMARDDSELTEEELQAKKKAQNRAAQRAFRERKESKLKELEAKLNRSEAEKQKLLDQLTYFRSQNEQQQKSNALNASNEGQNQAVLNSRNDRFTFPKSQVSFISEMTDGHPLSENAELLKVYDAPDFPGTKLLTVGSVWDYLHLKAEEYEMDDHFFDVEAIMNRLKGRERCHGYGPAYPLEVVDQAIEESLN